MSGARFSDGKKFILNFQITSIQNQSEISWHALHFAKGKHISDNESMKQKCSFRV